MPDTPVAGLDSAVMFGKGEPGSGQPNEFAGELLNWWIRCDRIVDSDTPPVIFTPTGDIPFEIYGRFDLRFNGDDSVLSVAVYDNGGSHRIDTLFDFSQGKIRMVHEDAIGTTEEKAYWYLSSNNDDIFHSIDARDGSYWLYNQTNDFYFLVQNKQVTVSNIDETKLCRLDVNDGSSLIYGSGFQYTQSSGRTVAQNTAATVYAAIDATDGSVYSFNASWFHFFRNGVATVSNSASTSFASINATDGSIWAYNASNFNFKYHGNIMVLYNTASAPGYCSLNIGATGDVSQLSLGANDYLGVFVAAEGGNNAIFVKNNAAVTGFEYNESNDNLRIYSSGNTAHLYPYQLTISDGTNTGTYEPSELTLTASGSGTVSMSAGDLPSGKTAYFQQISICVDGAIKQAYVLMTDPA